MTVPAFPWAPTDVLETTKPTRLDPLVGCRIAGCRLESRVPFPPHKFEIELYDGRKIVVQSQETPDFKGGFTHSLNVEVTDAD